MATSARHISGQVLRQINSLTFTTFSPKQRIILVPIRIHYPGSLHHYEHIQKTKTCR